MPTQPDLIGLMQVRMKIKSRAPPNAGCGRELSAEQVPIDNFVVFVCGVGCLASMSTYFTVACLPSPRRFVYK